jgi:hypothetical protein
MKYPALALASMVCGMAAANAQSAIPDIKGTWTGKDKSIVYGTNPHHPGSPPAAFTPRVQDFEFTFVVDGEEGRLAWGHSFSKVAITNEPFAWATSTDGKTVVGADGYFQMSVLSADRMEMCYAHAGISPTQSIVATCYIMNRTR